MILKKACLYYVLHRGPCMFFAAGNTVILHRNLKLLCVESIVCIHL